jgi:hypothetical protein
MEIYPNWQHQNYTVGFWRGAELGFELRDLHLLGRCSTT